MPTIMVPSINMQVFFNKHFISCAFVSATPIHDGMRTPMRDRAWNPYTPMSPPRYVLVFLVVYLYLEESLNYVLTSIWFEQSLFV